MSIIKTQIQKNGCSGWVDWGETLIACYPAYDEVAVGDCYSVITDYDYVMKLTPKCDLRLKLKVKQAKIPLYMIIHNEDFYYSFDMRNSSNSGRMNYCDSLRITRCGSEFESDFEDKGLKDSIEVGQIFSLLDHIQLILETILPSLEPIVGRIQPCGSGVTNVNDLVELYNLIESTPIKALCEQLWEISFKVIDSQQFKDSINQNLPQGS